MSFAGLVFLSLLFPVLTIFFFIFYRRKRFTGYTIFISRAVASDGKNQASGLFSISNRKSWFRVGVKFQLTATNSKFPDSNHRYCLSIEDENHDLVFREERLMSDFFSCSWHKKQESVYEFDVVLLEFKPRVSGIYELKFDLESHGELSSIESLLIQINEISKPLKRKPFVHTVADLEKT